MYKVTTVICENSSLNSANFTERVFVPLVTNSKSAVRCYLPLCWHFCSFSHVITCIAHKSGNAVVKGLSMYEKSKTMILFLAEKNWHSFLGWMVWMLIQLSKGCCNNVSTLGRKDFDIPFKGWMNCWFDRDINIHSIHCIVSATWRKEQKKTMKWFCFQKIGRTCFCLCKLAWKYVISSVRSSNSHPDLLVITSTTTTTTPLFQIHTGPQHWTFTFWATTAI